MCCQTNNSIFSLSQCYPHITASRCVRIQTIENWLEKKVYDWKRKTHNQVLNKAMFGSLLCHVFEVYATSVIIKNGFRKCGLSPFDPDAVDYARCMKHKSRDVAPIANNPASGASFTVEHLLYIESLMPRGRAEE
uniref:Uncharacterized protein n=1 Tax=Cacopsylla melanoneura TaxID=428564 RepID=A0A8D8RU36_9HEMI